MSDLAELHFCVPAHAGSAVASLLTEHVGTGLEQRDPSTIDATDSDQVELVVWVPSEHVAEHTERVERLVQSLREMGSAMDSYRCFQQPVEEKQWREAYKKYFKVSRVGRRFVVKPSWAELSAAADDLVIEIDPGMAFGTGTHASTRLVLRAIERIHRTSAAPQRVLDLGCGSGIVAIAAARIWPESRVVAVDCDPTAVEVCRENVAKNNLDQRITSRVESASEIEGHFDVVLANLNFETLSALRPSLPQHVLPLGRIVLSGLLAEQAAEVCSNCCADLSLQPEYGEEEEGWRALLLKASS